MRARHFSPIFDRLDPRISLSDVTSGTSSLVMPGDEIDPVAIIVAYQTTDPSANNPDPMNPPTPDVTNCYVAPVSSS